MNDNDSKTSDAGGEPDERLDYETAERLSRLRMTPVDAARLDALVRAQIGRRGDLDLRALRHRPWFARPMRVAASILTVIGVLAIVLLSNAGGPALASPALMAQVHDDMVTGKTPVMQVESVEAANRMLGAEWPDSPGIPSMPSDHVMACCMKSVKTKKVACVLLKNEGREPVTMTVAKASDMSLPDSPTVLRNGITYHVQSFHDLAMVMSERNGRWVCLIGKVSPEHLMDLAAKLQF